MADRSIVVRLKADVADYNGKMKDASKRTSDFIAQNEASLNHLGGVSAGIGAVLLGGVGVAVKAFADFDKQMSSVAATGADARGSMAELRQAAIDMGASTSFSATEAAAGIENLLKAGVSAKEVLGGGLKGALDLAAAGELDVADAAEVAATAMTQFKLKGSDVPHIADLLAAGAGKAAGEVSDMAQALNQSGLVAASMGMSIEETTGALAAFASAGLIGSDAGTSLKTMLQRLSNPAKEAANLMDDLGIKAYDSSGNFAGLESIAGQLKGKLSELSPAQRDAAMATIFGSDAVRAANVLYSQGAEGIAEWTKAVNDQGFAAETAAVKLDNLAGDLEGLGGAVESGLIQAGSGANDVLRGMVQGLTGVVNAVSKLPAPVIQGGMAIAGIGGAAALMAGGLVKAVTMVSEVRTSITTLSTAAKAAGVSLKGLTLAAGGIGLILAGAAIAFGAFANAQADSEARVTDFTSAIQGQTEAVNENSRAVAAKILQDRGAFDAARQLGLSLDTVTEASLGNASAMALVESAIQRAKVATEEQRFAIAASVDEFNYLAADLVEAGSAQAKLRDAISGTNGEFNTAVEKARQMEEATAGAGGAAGAAAKKLGTLGDSAEEGADDFAKLTKQINDAASAMLQLSGSEMGLEAAIDDATASLKENGKTLDIGTAKGRANKAALDQIASAALALNGAQAKASKSAEVMDASTMRARTSFLKTAQQMGLNKLAAEQLADRYGLIPKTVATVVTAPGATVSASQAADLNKRLRGLPDTTKAKIVTEANASGYEAAMKMLRDADGKVATSYIRIMRQTVSSNGGVIRGPVKALAGGGPVYGPGTTTSDSIPAMLSKREFVHQASAHDFYGSGVMWALNQKRIPKSVFTAMGFAEGGSPSSRTPMPMPAAGYGAGVAPVVQVFIGERELTDIVDVRMSQRSAAVDARVRRQGVSV